MHRVGRWFDRGKSSLNASTQSLDSLEESQNLEAALRAVELIMDDDIKGAEKGLAEGNSSFHKLAKGTLAFMKAALGFEQEFMKEASEMLYEAESSASASHSKAQHDSRSFNSTIYDKGTEFILCQAESQIMSAVVGVLNESLTESIRGFYKLRKAYITLDSIVQMEASFSKRRPARSLSSSRNQSMENLPSSDGLSPPERVDALPQHSVQPAHPSALRNAENADAMEKEESDDEFHEVDDRNEVTESYTGHLDTDVEDDARTELDIRIERMNLTHGSSGLQPEGMLRRSTTISSGLLTEGPESEVFSNPLDVFIHSGTNLMSGLLNLLISIIPPAFSKLLYIVGFRGDRERGIRMLWQASRFSNVNGAMAGLILFGWYNGIIGFCDIISDTDPSKPEDVEGYPAKRLEGLLLEMRRRYPNSHLWIVEEARTEASKRNLDNALSILAQPGKSQLKQIEALHMFEKSLSAMHAHKYQLCADSMLTCVDLNAWSRALYYYIAASSHLSLYRYDKSLSAKDKEKHAKLAEELFKAAPTKVGKKKMMGRQLPFDLFVARKISKWEERATRWGCSFLGAIGVSPLDEMIFLWNGFKKMNQAQLEDCLGNLAWSETTPNWDKEDVDEYAILDILKAVVLRSLRLHEDSKAVLSKKLLHQGAHEFKGVNKDDWMAPTAHHEMAVNFWMQRTGYTQQHGTRFIRDPAEQLPPVDLKHDAKLVQEVKVHLEKAKSWEKYELDARLGMKITAALAAVKRWEQRHAPALR
ncbi:Mitochondrial outer membrane protein iml2 [Cladophialophora chaetospira]|uniref:Inclusion body clearance protein IML2 n=1 Tax=Cladophialophora chaetospira TaxID=386627 RepID=A0AA38UED0_9EURO|nr:Mitochondrial outer membrane protein iml2 [Cladophialophora chaetospira]